MNRPLMEPRRHIGQGQRFGHERHPGYRNTPRVPGPILGMDQPEHEPALWKLAIAVAFLLIVATFALGEFA